MKAITRWLFCSPWSPPVLLKPKSRTSLMRIKDWQGAQDLGLKPPEKGGGAERTQEGRPWGQAGPGFVERKVAARRC